VIQPHDHVIVFVPRKRMVRTGGKAVPGQRHLLLMEHSDCRSSPLSPGGRMVVLFALLMLVPLALPGWATTRGDDAFIRPRHHLACAAC
jgi:hypothetical protein